MPPSIQVSLERHEPDLPPLTELPRTAASTSASQVEDVADLSLAARGDRTALARLYDRHSSLLLALGIRLLGERRESEDVLHDCFVEAWKHAGDYDPRRATVKTWLVLRMRSRCLDRLRSAAWSRRESMGDRPDETLSRSTPENQPPDLDMTVDANRLRAALVSLPEEQRAVIVHAFFDGLSSSEIADELQVPIGTVKSRVRAAMAKLRVALGAPEP